MPQLADTAVSTIVTSTNGVPIVVERAMWWPGRQRDRGARPTITRRDDHRHALGDGRGRTRRPARPSRPTCWSPTRRPRPARRTVTLHVRGRQRAAGAHAIAMAPSSRLNIPVAVDFPSAAGRRFGAIVESIGTPRRADCGRTGDVLQCRWGRLGRRHQFAGRAPAARPQLAVRHRSECATHCNGRPLSVS